MPADLRKDARSDLRKMPTRASLPDCCVPHCLRRAAVRPSAGKPEPSSSYHRCGLRISIQRPLPEQQVLPVPQASFRKWNAPALPVKAVYSALRIWNRRSSVLWAPDYKAASTEPVRAKQVLCRRSPIPGMPLPEQRMPQALPVPANMPVQRVLPAPDCMPVLPVPENTPEPQVRACRPVPQALPLPESMPEPQVPENMPALQVPENMPVLQVSVPPDKEPPGPTSVPDSLSYGIHRRAILRNLPKEQPVQRVLQASRVLPVQLPPRVLPFLPVRSKTPAPARPVSYPPCYTHCREKDHWRRPRRFS